MMVSFTAPRAAAAVVIALTFAALGAATDAYAASGDLDRSFSGDGIQTTDLSGEFDAVRSVAVQPDGKILAAGRSGNDDPDFAVTRYNADGSLDASFSGDGKQITDFGGFDEAFGMALQPDGKIVVVGDSGTSGIDFAVARYNADGSLDPTFSGDGKQLIDAGGDDDAKGVTVQPDGKLVVVGSRNQYTTLDDQVIDWALARLNADGSLDDGFSDDGIQTTDFGGDDGASAVKLQSDGKLVVAGAAAGAFGIARYDSAGELDASYSGDGKQTTGFGGDDDDYATSLAIQSDGKIVAAGATRTGSASSFALARYLSDGSLDTTFAGDGKQTTDFPGDIDIASGVAVDGDGRIVAAGGLEDTFNGEAGPYDLAIARYRADGTLDSGFSGDGKQTTDLGDFETASGGLALQPDGKIVVAGHNGHFLLARYLASDDTAPETTPGTTPGTTPATTPAATTPAAGGSTTGAPADTTPPRFTLSMTRAVKLARSLVVGVRCPDELCQVRVSATVRVPKAQTYKLKTVRKALASRKPTKLTVRLPRAAINAARRGLKAHKHVVVMLKITIADSAGNRAVRSRQIKLKR
jgi:uncharacterized delta-60 repeat protein